MDIPPAIYEYVYENVQVKVIECNNNIGGFYTNNTIYVNKNLKGDVLQGTLQHEYTHYINRHKKYNVWLNEAFAVKAENNLIKRKIEYNRTKTWKNTIENYNYVYTNYSKIVKENEYVKRW